MNNDTRNLVNDYVKAISNGDKVAFEKLYLLMKPILKTILMRRFYNHQDIEEIIDDVFYSIIEKSKYLLFFDNCFKWIIKIATNTLNNHIRKSANRAKLMKMIPIGTHTIFNENKFHTFMEIKNLEDTTHQYLILYKFYCKMKIDEIAMVMNMSRSTIYRELTIALEILKEKLK